MLMFYVQWYNASVKTLMTWQGWVHPLSPPVLHFYLCLILETINRMTFLG